MDSIKINHHLNSKIYLPLAFLIIFIVLLIPLYVNVFKTSPKTKSLFLALEDQQMSLTNTTTFTDLITFYSSSLVNGNFQVTSTSPSSLKFKVINSDNQDVTTGYTLANDISQPSYIYFNNLKSGNVTLQYINSSNSNYVTRIDIEF